ncbi:hypothetical protein JCM6882_006353 [Rhodosporidiobolus microsporus]
MASFPNEPCSLPLTPASSQDSYRAGKAPHAEEKSVGFSFNASPSTPFFPPAHPPPHSARSSSFAPSSASSSTSSFPHRTPSHSHSRTGSTSSSAHLPLLPHHSSFSSRPRTSSRPSLLTPPPSPPHSRTSPSSHAHPHSHKRSESTSSSTASIAAAAAQGFMSSAISDSADQEELCPICCEGLIAFRLAGEKPHVVPVCGHRLHHACFEAVYGDLNRAKARQTGSLGLCGVCRREMKVGEASDGPGKGSKFAKLSGIPSSDAPSNPFKMRSRTKGTLFDDDDDDDGRRDDSQDDDLVQLPPPGSLANPHPPLPPGTRASSHSTGSTLTASSLTRRGSTETYLGAGSSISNGSSSRGTSSSVVHEIVKPVVTVRAEHASVERSTDPDKKQSITCQVSIEMPPRYPAPMHLLQLVEHQQPLVADPTSPTSRPGLSQSVSAPLPRAPSSAHSGPASVRSIPRSNSPTSIYSAYAFGSTPSAAPHGGAGPSGEQFDAIVQDLQDRMADWKGHTLAEFGRLRLWDHIQVRKDTAMREFLVYLFDEAILCVTDDKRKGINKVVDSVTGNNDKLRLKGRVYLRHVSRVIDSSKNGDLSLTITMSDDAVAEFVMLFKERTSLDLWRAQIEKLLAVHSPVGSSYSNPQAPPPGRAPSVSTASDQSRTTSSAFSGYTRTTSTSLAPSSGVIHEEDETGGGAGGDEFGRFAVANGPGYASSVKSSSIGSYTPSSGGLPRFGGGALPSHQNALNLPRSFTPLDLMLILSVPTAGPTALKTGILKNALEFLLAHVGPRTRVSVVTYSAGEGSRGVLRKTPFIAVGKAEGKKRLEKVVEELGCDAEDLTSMVAHQEERVNVVTACNLALDIVLQRKAKSALTGMVLLNDGRDGAQKAQMDLVMARAEAANVPIHAIGYGRSHDPSSLWLLSNHSGGSYLFVKEFYDLRDALAGCVGGILSIAATNVRLHIKVPEKRFFRIRKVSGTPGAIVSRTGTDVDVEIGELRFGERKDLIVEVEMSLGEYGAQFGTGLRERHEQGQQQAVEFATATDAFFLSKVGINPSTLDDSSNLYDDQYDDMPDEAPLFEVNAAYRDPAAGKSISRLNHSPCLLTITINPPSSPHSRHSPPASAPEIVRRRMELLVSDMLSRALLLMTRRNDAQAARLLEETKRIISTISGTIVPPSSSSGSMLTLANSVGPGGGGRRPSAALAATALTHKTLAALAEDVDAVHEACLNRELFDTSGRYLAAQQAVVLRDQRAWTNRSATERLFFHADNSLYLVGKSQNWVSPSSA